MKRAALTYSFIFYAIVLLLTGSIFPEISFPIFVIYALCIILTVSMCGEFNDFKKPFVLFFMVYSFLLLIGLKSLYPLNLFNPEVARLVLAGLVMFAIGYSVCNKVPSGKDLSKIQKRYYHKYWLYILYGYTIIFGILGLLQFFKNAGGIIILEPDMITRRAEIIVGIGYGFQFFIFAILPFLVIYADRVLDSRRVFTPGLLLFAVFCFLGLLSRGFRTPIIELAIMMILIYYYGSNKKLTLKSMLIASFLVIAFTGVVSAYREGNIDLNSIFAHLEAQTYVNLLSINYILNIFPDVVNFQYGHTYLMNFALIRPGPDTDFTGWLTQQLGLTHFTGGTTPSIIGEWYLNFGYPGIYLGMLSLGAFSAFLHKKLSSCYDAFHLVRWVLIAGSFLKVITGGISNVIMQLTLNLIVLEVLAISSRISFYKRSEKDFEQNPGGKLSFKHRQM